MQQAPGYYTPGYSPPSSLLPPPDIRINKTFPAIHTENYDLYSQTESSVVVKSRTWNVLDPGECVNLSTNIIFEEKIKSAVIVLLSESQYLPPGLQHHTTRADGGNFIYHGFKGILKCSVHNTSQEKVYLHQGAILGRLNFIPFCLNTLPDVNKA